MRHRQRSYRAEFSIFRSQIDEKMSSVVERWSMSYIESLILNLFFFNMYTCGLREGAREDGEKNTTRKSSFKKQDRGIFVRIKMFGSSL